MSIDATSKPRAFLSHSSADKPRFVSRLDVMLRDRGIDVWLDTRDLLPGTNLIDEIFTHGISKSDVVVVVLSKNSIHSRWVSEELSVAIVQKINGVVKMVIPVVIDDVTPPDALKATVWERIPDLDRLELHADRIAASMFGRVPAPVAPAPPYAGLSVHRIGTMTADDERVFVAACESLITGEAAYPFVQLQRIAAQMHKLGMTDDLFWESVTALEQSYFFSDPSHHTHRGRPGSVRVPSHAFEAYLAAYRAQSYRGEKTAILSAIVNDGASHSRAIAQNLNIDEYIVDHVLVLLESSGQIQASHATDGIHFRFKSTLGRVLREMQDGARPRPTERRRRESLVGYGRPAWRVPPTPVRYGESGPRW